MTIEYTTDQLGNMVKNELKRFRPFRLDLRVFRVWVFVESDTLEYDLYRRPQHPDFKNFIDKYKISNFIDESLDIRRLINNNNTEKHKMAICYFCYRWLPHEVENRIKRVNIDVETLEIKIN